MPYLGYFFVCISATIDITIDILYTYLIIKGGFMKKSAIIFMPNTAEYVAMHALWQHSRGRKPSAIFPFERNPQKALIWAKKHAYFPKSGKYLNGVIPHNYKCGECGATGCKLWREYQTSSPNILCAKCAAKNQKKNIDDIDAEGMRSSDVGGRTDQIGWYVPAVPLEDNNGYWGYTSVPQPGCDWWKKLSTLPSLQMV